MDNGRRPRPQRRPPISRGAEQNGRTYDGLGQAQNRQAAASQTHNRPAAPRGEIPPARNIPANGETPRRSAADSPRELYAMDDVRARSGEMNRKSGARPMNRADAGRVSRVNTNPASDIRRAQRGRRRKKSNVYAARAVIAVIVIAILALIGFGIFALVSALGGNSAETTAPETAAPQTAAPVVTEPESTTEQLTQPPETEAPEPAYELNFVSDLSEYEQYMNPADASPYLILVNKTNLLASDYVPQELTDVADTRSDGRATQQMVFTAEKALEAFFIEMRANGYKDVSVTSAYRSYDYQTTLFDGYVSQYSSSMGYDEAVEYVSTFSAKPGTSEHQSGLCCDMHNLSAADQSFADTDAGKWMAENCWKFGFILRFPLGRDDVTGYSFEPWHFRYVGRAAAYEITSGGLTLEEYLAAAE